MDQFQEDSRNGCESSGIFFREPGSVNRSPEPEDLAAPAENKPMEEAFEPGEEAAPPAALEAEEQPFVPEAEEQPSAQGAEAASVPPVAEPPEAGAAGEPVQPVNPQPQSQPSQGAWAPQTPPNPGYYNGYNHYNNGYYGNTDGVYRNAGAGRRESPYAQSPYVTGGQPMGDWGAAYTPPPPKKPKPPKAKKTGKGKKAPKVIAAVLALILAGTGGGILGAWLTGNRWEKTTQALQADFQSQLDQLKEQQSAAPQFNVAPSPETGAAVNSVATSGELTPRQVYAQNVASVVSITNKGVISSGWGQQEFVGSGSGFILTANGYVLTNYHVVENAVTLTVSTYAGTEYEAELVGYDSFSDVALLKVDATDLPAVTVGDSDALVVGDQVAAIGNPLGELTSSQTIGYVSAKDRTVNTDGTILNMIQTDAAINSGNSGGPLFNMYGQVVGITTAKYSGSTSSGASIEGIGFAIPINDVMALMDDLMEYGYVKGQAYLGITVLEMDAAVAEAYGLPTGPKVNSVVAGSCAEKAGVQVNDIIVAIGEIDVASYSDLAYALRSFHAGDSTTITVYRGGQTLTLDVTLDEKPANTTPTEPTQPEEQTPDPGFWYDYLFPNP